ncbi:MAG TPA: hypothetical protein VLQ45_23450, partial [Thermoanaerobaculia bacterium]|nr:hypothetical protein [Thermoanaerobaculia bacterium]
MTRSIAVIGAGQAGLQLGIGLLEKGFAVTLVADRSADEVFNGRLTATAGLFATALSYEEELGLDLWADQAPLIDGVHIDLHRASQSLLRDSTLVMVPPDVYLPNLFRADADPVHGVDGLTIDPRRIEAPGAEKTIDKENMHRERLCPR